MISFLTSLFLFVYNMKTKEKENSSTIIKEILSDRILPHAPSALFTVFERWCTLNIKRILSDNQNNNTETAVDVMFYS